MTILLFIAILAFLILVHEFGHFIIAKKSGMRVDEFGFGFPPRIFGIRKGETMYSINWLPFGGFVKIAGEDDTESHTIRHFASKPAWIQALVLTAGVAFNILSALLIFIYVAWAGSPISIGDEDMPHARDARVLISYVAPDSPAQNAGLLSGDTILSVQAQSETRQISSMSDMQAFIAMYAGEDILLTIQRGKETQTLAVFARPHPPEGEGALGVGLARVGIINYPIHIAVWEGMKQTARMTALTVQGFVEIIRFAIAGENVGAYVAGPVGIVSLVGQYYNLGFIFLLQLTALIAINLAVINLIPFPALDGGRLFFLFIETVIRRPIPKKVTGLANTAGFAILIGLIVLITISDVSKLL